MSCDCAKNSGPSMALHRERMGRLQAWEGNRRLMPVPGMGWTGGNSMGYDQTTGVGFSFLLRDYYKKPDGRRAVIFMSGFFS